MTEQKTPKTIHRGRAALEAFAEAQRFNAFLSDTHFQRLISIYAPKSRREVLEEALTNFGEVLLEEVDEFVRQNNEPANLPRLARYSDHGSRVEEIDHHPSYHFAGEYIYGSGIMAAYKDHPNSIGALSRFYLSSYNGEAGHNCPLACTAGVIRVLQELGTEDLQEAFLPDFLNPIYGEHLEGAQFLTEVQGGSDVGQNGTWAEQEEDGTWRIFGEKWFCSNIDADVFLMTARVDGFDEEGTPGLGLFLVPRTLETGQVNEFYVRRLKEKLGTRSMASGEADFRGALAFHMGEVGEGFKNMMELVINTSRLYNAVGGCGVMRRAYLVARTYADHRIAFGQKIGNYPLVQETLANLKSEQETMLSGNIYLVAMQDKIDSGEATEQERAFFRMALNLNKTTVAKAGRWACVEAIEILGGNGAIESFSVLPRLLRDSIVYENWEGTHNTLYMQVLRDMKKYALHQAYFAQIQALLDASSSGEEANRSAELAAFAKGLATQAEALLEAPLPVASLGMRRIVDEFSYLFYATVRTWERATMGARDSEESDASLEHFMDRHIRKVDNALEDPSYFQRLSTLYESD